MLLNLVCFIVLFQDVYLVPKHDVEIEGRMHIGDSFLSQLTQGLHEQNHLNEKNAFLKLFENSPLNLKKEIHTKKLKTDDTNRHLHISRRNQPIDTVEENAGKKDLDLKTKISEDTLEKESIEKSVEVEINDKKGEEIQDNEKEKQDINDVKVKSTKYTDLPVKKEENKPADDSNINTKPQTKPLKITDDISTSQFLDHIISNGKEKIKYISEQMQLKLAVDTNITSPLINSALASYASKMRSYISYITKQEPKSEIDREFLLLDLVASCNMLLYSEERKLLNQFTEKRASNVTQYEIDLLTEEVYKQYVNHKKQEIFYICDKLSICRPFPGFSDYFAELISELLKLSDEHLSIVVQHAAKLITNRAHFFKSFIRNKIVHLIGEKLQAISSKMDDVKETLSAIRSIITQRFKLMKTKDYKLKIRTKAVRILIDVIDKTFSLAAGEELTAITFDTVVQALRRWKAAKENNVYMPLKLLMQHIVGVIRHNWDEGIQDEVATLTDVIMVGKTEERELYKELFARGSAFGKESTFLDDPY